MERSAVCPSCGGLELKPIYRASGVPAHSVLLMSSREAALEFPRGEILLGLCLACGAITNLAFDGGLLAYSGECEETQGCSETFRTFDEGLAERLTEGHGIRGKHVLEIGCGKGEFLDLLCRMGRNTGLGYDPAYRSGRGPGESGGSAEFVREFYTASSEPYPADLVCCKMTLEHVQHTGEFARLLLRAASYRPGALAFLQVPNAERILREGAFWDVYYEHCSYFTLSALKNLLTRNGFCLVEQWEAYQGQYILAVARPSGEDVAGGAPPPGEDSAALELAEGFGDRCLQKLGCWRGVLKAAEAAGRTAVLWGGGSKAVAFLAAVDVPEAVSCVVDINPHRQGTYIAGTGHPIVGPEALKTVRPHLVVVMNPAYSREIRSSLDGLGLSPEVTAL